MDSREYVVSLIEKSRKAQKEFEGYSQEKVDEAVKAIGKIIYDNGDPLALLAVEETRMGDYQSKIAKNMGKAKVTWHRLKGVKSRGIIEKDEVNGIIKVAKPIGVLGCIPPTTNPTMTPMHNAMCALKGGNSVIVSPHPRSKKTTLETCRLMRLALESVGAPVDLIQCIPEPTLEISGLVMQLCDATIATGGPAMVKAAYSSGKPSFGVGAGNVQTIIDGGTNLDEIAPMLIRSRAYDNGVLCTCEQCVHIAHDRVNTLIGKLIDLGAYYMNDENEIEKFRAALFPNGSILGAAVGQKAVDVAKLCGISVPENTQIILVKIDKFGKDELLAKEKLCPVMCIAGFDSFEEGVANAKTNLLNEGLGHSIVVHSFDQKHIEYAGECIPVSRIGVNMIGSSGLGGGLDNGLVPTATLGCGTWGNNSLSENLFWNHLVNIARIAYRKEDAVIPTDDEIWS